MPEDPTQLPDDLPVPEDDGAADHLPGTRVPPVELPSTDSWAVKPRRLSISSWLSRRSMPASGTTGVAAASIIADHSAEI